MFYFLLICSIFILACSLFSITRTIRNINKQIKEKRKIRVSLSNVSVNKELSRDERIAEFVQQIKNPYHFKCGRFTVQASFSAEGATLEECIKGILR